jgi:hypothetical protein
MKDRRFTKSLSLATLTTFLGLFILGTGMLQAATQPPDGDDIWRDLSPLETRGLALTQEPLIGVDSARLLVADTAALQDALGRAPLAGSAAADATAVVLSLPLPGGENGHFQVELSSIMEPALAAKFPEIQTYRAYGLDDPTAYARLDWTPAGFHALILSAAGSVYIDPYSRNDTTTYMSYRKADYANDLDKRLIDSVLADGEPATRSAAAAATGPTLRTYRLAVAATGEYTQYHGGTVSAGMSAIATTVNRVNTVYERELSIHLNLVANNNLIVYTDPNGDPYSNSDGFAMLGQNQATLDGIIGSPNYDIGHVFSTGGGGVASLGSVCSSTRKAQGVTGNSAPVGDPFDIDYVSHEMGHQFGAEHTFNSTALYCGGGNRSAGAAYEPGSGSTIMAYAGICGSHDLQPHSDDYFHGKSLDQINGFVASAGGCGNNTGTGNTAPSANAGSDQTIPARTPFTLTGSGSDGDGDSLSYNWEEFDLGSAPDQNSALPNTDQDGPRPIFRSRPSSSEPWRMFPALPSILDFLAKNQNSGEALPTIDRTMNFRLTVRDNKGGVDSDNMQVAVVGGAGPFRVTAPDGSLKAAGFDQTTVTWDVAQTNLAPINCSAVDISLSTDGGDTFAESLAAGAANDGSQNVMLPNVSTTQARVKVACASSIFFDISDSNFTIEDVVPITGTITIVKQTTPAGGKGFKFGGALGAFTLNDGQSKSFEVIAGAYAITEQAAASWFLQDINCDDSDSIANVETRTATIQVGEDESVTCTFSNVASGDNVSPAVYIPLLSR